MAAIGQVTDGRTDLCNYLPATALPRIASLPRGNRSEAGGRRPRKVHYAALAIRGLRVRPGLPGASLLRKSRQPVPPRFPLVVLQQGGVPLVQVQRTAEFHHPVGGYESSSRGPYSRSQWSVSHSIGSILSRTIIASFPRVVAIQLIASRSLQSSANATRSRSPLSQSTSNSSEASRDRVATVHVQHHSSKSSGNM